MTKSHRLCARKATDKNIYIYTHTREAENSMHVCKHKMQPYNISS